jgi:hypothetical protein
MRLGHYLMLVHKIEYANAGALRTLAGAHRDEVDVAATSERLAQRASRRATALEPYLQRYGAGEVDHSTVFTPSPPGPLALLRDLHAVALVASDCALAWEVIGPAAAAARDQELFDVSGYCVLDATTQLKWLRTRMKEAAPQTLVVA